MDKTEGATEPKQQEQNIGLPITQKGPQTKLPPSIFSNHVVFSSPFYPPICRTIHAPLSSVLPLLTSA
jgi:hypothetical protein